MKPPIRRKWYNRPGWSPFGRVGTSGKSHTGFDYYVPAGTPVFATGPGVVTFIGWNDNRTNGFGHNVTIKMDDGRTTLDAHFQNAPLVRRNQRVDENTQLGTVGNTGNAWNVFWTPPGETTAFSHDHHNEWNKDGVLVNPLGIFGASWAAQNAVVITPDKEEKDMPYAEQARNDVGAIYYLDGLTYQSLTLDQYNNNIPALGPYIQYSKEGFAQKILDINYRRETIKALTANQSSANIDVAALAARVEANLNDDFDRLATQIAEINTALGTPLDIGELATEILDQTGERLTRQ